jgi:hypothetical protein
VPLQRKEVARGVPQAVECLLYKCKALSSNPSPTRKKRKENTTQYFFLSEERTDFLPLSLCFASLLCLRGSYFSL